MNLRTLQVMIAAALPASLLAPSKAHGQAFARLSAGATASSALVGEVIENPISLRPTMSPTGALLLGWTFQQGYRLGIEGRYASGTLQVHDATTSAPDDLGKLATLQVALIADGPLHGPLRWEGLVGLLHYRPSDASGVFRDGAPTPLLLGGGISWSRSVGGQVRVVVGARYDYHAFHTPRLRTQGYSGSQAVHRGALTIGLERGL